MKISSIIKGKKFRRIFSQVEIFKKINKFLFIYLLLSSAKEKKAFKYFFCLTEINSFISKAKLKNKCVFTGRSKSVNKKLSISRIELRRNISLGLIPGYKKAVW